MEYLSTQLEALRALIESDQRAGLIAKGYIPENHMHDCRLKFGRKYVNVDIGRSGAYMVELETGRIFGIKGYGVIHRGHQYGTLDTIGEWDWSGYRAVQKYKQRIAQRLGMLLAT